MLKTTVHVGGYGVIIMMWLLLHNELENTTTEYKLQILFRELFLKPRKKISSLVFTLIGHLRKPLSLVSKSHAIYRKKIKVHHKFYSIIFFLEKLQ